MRRIAQILFNINCESAIIMKQRYTTNSNAYCSIRQIVLYYSYSEAMAEDTAMLRKRLKCLIDRFDISVRQLYAMYVCIFFLPLLLTLLLTNNAISQLESQVQKTGRTMTHQIKQ